MPHFCKIGLGTGLMVFFVALFIAPVHAQEWALKTSGVTNDLNNLACVDERTCYAVGGAPFTGGPGMILKTTNGGESWSAQSIPTTNPLRGISCPSAAVCYVAGDGGALLKTTNGGATWTAQSAPNLSNFSGQAQPWFWDMWATSETTAVAVGNIGAIYRTTNGGGTWTQIVVREVETHNLAGVFFANDSTGWILGGSNVLKTTDGGLTWWRQLPAQLGALMWDAFSFDGETVWISGSTVHKSPDGGVTWTRQIGATGITYRGIEFVDPDTGWIVGTGGFIKKTVDGGSTWVSQTSRTTKILRDIQCIGPALCYAVGDDGAIVRYGTPPPPPQADLTIGDRTLTCPAGELGLEFAEYRYSVVVRNIGTGDAGAFTVRLQGLDAAGNPVGTPLNNIVTGLADGVSATIEGQANVGLLNPTATATATVRITADILGQVTESNETNNVATMTQTCATATRTTPDTITTPANRPPNPPTSLSQHGSATDVVQPAGYIDNDGLLVFKAVVSDPDGDTVGLDLEIRPLSTAFTNTPTSAGALIASGSTATFTVGGLADGGYHWQARAANTASSAWVAFGSNAESAADFTISRPPEPTPVAEPAAPPPVEHNLDHEPTVEIIRTKDEAAKRQLEKIKEEAPKILLPTEQYLIKVLGEARDVRKEDFAEKQVEEIMKVALPAAISEEKKEAIKQSITTFVAYGTGTTQVLGGGERAGVVNSFQEAFHKLPETQKDWEDVIKIANGRFPSQINTVKEDAAEDVFKKIYKRESVRTNPRDNAAVTIMSYGLRPASRNLNSEKVAIKTFRAIYKRSPKSASDWDTTRAIAYSGAKR